jgi:hypothetical protein
MGGGERDAPGQKRCRGSGVVAPSKDIQGLEMDGASAHQQSPERATRMGAFC